MQTPVEDNSQTPSSSRSPLTHPSDPFLFTPQSNKSSFQHFTPLSSGNQLWDRYLHPKNQLGDPDLFPHTPDGVVIGQVR